MNINKDITYHQNREYICNSIQEDLTSQYKYALRGDQDIARVVLKYTINPFYKVFINQNNFKDILSSSFSCNTNILDNFEYILEESLGSWVARISISAMHFQNFEKHRKNHKSYENVITIPDPEEEITTKRKRKSKKTDESKIKIESDDETFKNNIVRDYIFNCCNQSEDKQKAKTAYADINIIYLLYEVFLKDSLIDIHYIYDLSNFTKVFISLVESNKHKFPMFQKIDTINTKGHLLYTGIEVLFPKRGIIYPANIYNAMDVNLISNKAKKYKKPKTTIS
jgi:hypothetical protein